MITLQISRPLDAETRLAVARALTDPTAGVLGKKCTLTVLSHAEDWRVGSEGVDGVLTAFHLDARVVAGTHAKPEKSTYIYPAWQALDELVGPLHPASYIVGTDIPADSWGYAGETQELRHVRTRLAG